MSQQKVCPSSIGLCSAAIRDIGIYPVIPDDDFLSRMKSIYTTTDRLERYIEAYKVKYAYSSSSNKGTIVIVIADHENEKDPQLKKVNGQKNSSSKSFQCMSTEDLRKLMGNPCIYCALIDQMLH